MTDKHIEIYKKRFHKPVKLSSGGVSCYPHLEGTALDKDFQSFILEVKKEAVEEDRKRIQELIYKEMSIARNEGQPTSRLTSLSVKINKNEKRKKTT